MTTTKTATYKGRTYRLVYLGATQYGRRAKLAFTDGSKEFWVDASQVQVSAQAAPAAAGGKRSLADECGGCGRRCDRLAATCRHCGYDLSHDW